MIARLRQPAVNTFVVVVSIAILCAITLLLQRLAVASLCMRDNYPLAQYFFSINMLVFAFLGCLFMVSMFFYALAWPLIRTRYGAVKFLGSYFAVMLTMVLVAVYATDLHNAIGDPAINLRCYQGAPIR
jgi:hypothetical protein